MMKKTVFFLVFALLVLVTVHSAVAFDTTGSLFYYSFDNADISGTAVGDLSGNGNNGTNVGATTSATGKIGEAFYYDNAGSGSERVEADGSWTQGDKNVTLSFWFKPELNWVNSGSEGMFLYDTTSRWQFWRYNNALEGGMGNGAGEYTQIYNSGTPPGWWVTTDWTHMVIIYHPDERMEVFFNGTLFYNDTHTSNDASSAVMAIGNRYGATYNGFRGWIDEFYIIERDIGQAGVTELYNSGSGYNPYTAPSPEGYNSYTLSVTDLYDDSDLSGVNVTFASGCWNTTDASGDATVTNTSGCSALSGTLSSVTISKSGYAANASTYSIAENGTSNAGMYQGMYNVTSIETLVSGTVLGADNGTWSVNTTGGKNYTGNATHYPENIYLQNGSNSLTLQYTGASDWYDKDFTVNITAFENTAGAVTGVYDSIVNVTASTSSDSTIFNFTINVTQSNYSYEAFGNTTDGNLTFYLEQGRIYVFFIDADLYAFKNTTLNLTTSFYPLNFTLYQTNTFNMTFYDEQTNTVIDTETINVKLISNDYSSNYTTSNGTLEVGLLVPENYEIRYTGTSDYTYTRSYYVTLTNRSYNNLRLYQIDYNDSSFFVPQVQNEYGGVCEGETVQLMRGYIEGETVVGRVVEMTKTDPSGNGLFRIYPNNVYYKFLGTEGCGTFSTTYFKVTASSLTFPATTSSGILTSRNLFNEGVFSLTYNNDTQTYILTWLDDTNTVTGGCLEVIKNGATVVADSCSSGSTGSIIYTITDTNQTTYLARAKLTTSTTYSDYFDSLAVSFKEDYLSWGLFGVFIAFIVTLFFMFIGSSSTSGVVISGVVGLLLVAIIGIISFNWTALVGVIIIGVIIAYKAGRGAS